MYESERTKMTWVRTKSLFARVEYWKNSRKAYNQYLSPVSAHTSHILFPMTKRIVLFQLGSSQL